MSHVNKVLHSFHKTQPAPLFTHNQGFYVTQPICQILSAVINGCNQQGDEDNWKEHQAGANVCSKQLCEKTAAGGWNSCNQNRSSKEGGAGISMVPECFSTLETGKFLKKTKRQHKLKIQKSSGFFGFLPVLFQHTENIYLFYTSFSIS